MLLALFMVMYAISQIDNQKLVEFQSKMESQFKSKVPSSQNVTKYHTQNQNLNQNNIYNATTLEKMFKENITQSKSIKIIKEGRGLVVRVNDKMLFAEGSAVIKPEAKKTLAEIVTTLTKIDNPVIIEGHTDTIPIKNTKYPSNWELSTARATNIISYMIQNGKIPPKRLCAVGYGEYAPIGDNTSISGRMLNRRVDIIVLEK